MKKALNTKIIYKKNSYTLIDLIKRYDCCFFVEWQECFLCKSYILTMFKKTDFQATYTCSYTLANFFEISKKSSEKMIHQYQLHLAMMTCEFIKIIALDLNIDEKNSPSIVSSILSDDDGRMVYPCFLSSRILFMHMKKTKCPVLIILKTIEDNDIRKDFIIFEGGATQGSLLTKDNSLKDCVCMVVVCMRIASVSLSPLGLLRKLNHFGLYAMLLMSVAAHPQLSGLKLNPHANQLVPNTVKLAAAEKEIEQEFLRFKKSAQKNGFCKDNPSVLLIKHIFIDTISNQINLHQNTNNDIGVRETVNI